MENINREEIEKAWLAAVKKDAARKKKNGEDIAVGWFVPPWFHEGRLYPEQPCCEEGTCGDQNSKQGI